jgi:DNA-binding MarR family transcriptional regulator/GNAT superfamily N-acetyltransferase
MASLNPEELIASIREASRILVRELGFMSSTIAGTEHSASAVHALIEIGSCSPTKLLTASTLSSILNLEKSSVSRMLKKLVLAGEVREEQSREDAREKTLSLTPKGKDTLEGIEKFAKEQVGGALEKLPSGATPRMVLEGINSYASAWRAKRLGLEISASSEDKHKGMGGDITVLKGYRPGVVARCLDMHMRYYSQHHGFGASFEILLATGMADLVPRLCEPENEIFTAVDGRGEIVGTLWMDGNDLGDASKVHLRFFVVEVAGRGVGKMLVNAAMKLADETGKECHLWTFKGLLSARKLYDQAGFEIVDEGWNSPWGTELWVQHFVRKLGGKTADQNEY